MKIKTFLIALTFFSSPIFAEISVIVHPSNNSNLDKSSISRIFLGKAKSFPSGGQALPVNLGESVDATKQFNSSVLNKSGSQLKAYWSKLVFTGKGTPPKVVDSESELIKLIATNPNIIGYVDSSLVDGSVKVVGKF